MNIEHIDDFYSPQLKFIKLIYNGIAYYIHRDLFKEHFSKADNHLVLNHLKLMLISDYVVNIKTDELVKCRLTIEQIIDMVAKI